MSVQPKYIVSGGLVLLAVLAVGFTAGVSLASTHVALGTFLFSSALMLGPFVGVALLGCARVLAKSRLSRALYAVGGLLVLSAVLSIMLVPLGSPQVMIAMFISGLFVGSAALAAQARYV
ncbi:Hypothetical protein NG00_00067 [Corynebacterium camporealensis]|uniref:Uncharacterized protein n=1 Tax=Corynebacterium camporealensis TaxID=161896 RepID=A0A0F6T9Y9_9CORY|nr:hypothetical protein [Corynebacterium camporealensis]AKE38071.1 hypothetical protein UL81_00390 [Corynebacterium camporealensis]AVH87397.1 Hypothetical protein NG00_00067 [Corynebacterium camporealensis]MDY5840902.1 hypothetical protein [Corynebacterium camporealensis]